MRVASARSYGGYSKERIARDLDLVKMNVGLGAGEADGLRVGDEMDLVTAAGELKAELGGDDSAAAVGWITGDADLHGRSRDIAIGFARMVGDAQKGSQGQTQTFGEASTPPQFAVLELAD